MSANCMEDLADTLASSFAVSNNPNDPSRPHPRFSQYKGHREQVDTLFLKSTSDKRPLFI